MNAHRRFRRVTGCLVVAALWVGAVPAAGQERKTAVITFPRGGFAPVALTNGPLLIRSVSLKNRPSAWELRRARRRDRDDTNTLRWVFRVANSGRRDWHARIVVNVVAADGHLLASNDRNAEVDARDFHDQITVFTKIRTVDYPRAARAQIHADFFRY